MKVGIVTYHRSHNYGAMLQAAALQTALTQMGHDVWFIDYWPEHQRNIYRLFPKHALRRTGIRGKIRILASTLKGLPGVLRRRAAFHRFFRRMIEPFCQSANAKFDVIVYGSDQIWRKQLDGSGYNPVYFGNNSFRADRHLAYAASMGKLPETEQDRHLVHRLLKPLSSISVREADLQVYLTNSGLQKVALVSDPVFLLSSANWSRLAGESPIEPQAYLVFYDLLPIPKGIEKVCHFAHCLHLNPVRIAGRAERHPDKCSRLSAGPYEFLNLLKFSDYVVTSSFHGLAFALLFHKPFLAIFPSNAGRAKTLLASVGLQHRLVPADEPFVPHPEQIDWNHVDQALKSMREASVDWLSIHLQPEKGNRP